MHTSAKVNPVQIRSPYLESGSSELLPKSNAGLPVLQWVYVKIFMKLLSVFPEIWAKLWKNSGKKLPDADTGEDVFQHLIISSLLKGTFLVKF